MMTKTKCFNQNQNVNYPSHEIADDGQCLRCGAWFLQAESDDDEWDETVEFDSRDARDEAG